MLLRDYQIKIKEEIYQKWQEGAQNILVQLSTGAGKTVIFCNIVAEHKGAAIVIAHRMELVSQISLTLARHGIRHNIIAQKSTIRTIIASHMRELKKSFYDPSSKYYVAGVDTLIKLDAPWMKTITLVVQDEAHHVLRDNKWGKAATLFPNAKGLYPSATPVRADGYGLGRHADGIIDALIIGPSMRSLINAGYLSDYRNDKNIFIYLPPSDLDLSNVTISASGDYSPPKLRSAVHKSHITGDVVEHYKRIANGKLGVTFAVDIESATEIAIAFKTSGIPAEVISSKTHDLLRIQVMERFRRREILQLVNVDLLGEGVDVPAIEVVSMARPTNSYAVYAQQFGRALRIMEGKAHAIIIDHVGNVYRHGLPDAPRQWSLDRREKKSRGVISDNPFPIKTCLNPTCLVVYDRIYKLCPQCGHYNEPASRKAPEFVDGDLTELDIEVWNNLQKEIEAVDLAPKISPYLPQIAQMSLRKRHRERQEAQKDLRHEISLWAGYHKHSKGLEDYQIYRKFYYEFGIDIATAQTLNCKEAEKLTRVLQEAVCN